MIYWQTRKQNWVDLQLSLQRLSLHLRRPGSLLVLAVTVSFLICTNHRTAHAGTQPHHELINAEQVETNERNEEAVSTVIGSVVQAPANDAGSGLWIIRTDDGTEYQLWAVAEYTLFLSSKPALNDAVYLKIEPSDEGKWQILSILKVELSQGMPPDVAFQRTYLTIHGSVLARPDDAGGLGEWRVFTDDGKAEIVDVYDEVAFTKGVPNNGQDAFIQGWRKAANEISADTIEIDTGTNELAVGEEHTTILSGEVVDVSIVDSDNRTWHIRQGQVIYTLQSTPDSLFAPAMPSVGNFVNAIVIEKSDAQLPVVLEMSIESYARGEMLVRLQADVAIDAIADTYQMMVDTTVLTSARIYRLVTTNPTVGYLEHLSTQMADDPRIIWHEYNYTGALPIDGHPHRVWGWGGEDPGQINALTFSQIHIGSVHQAYSGAGQVVAVLDTGLDLEHPALQNRFLAGWDMVDDDAIPYDEGPGTARGHGTHVSGIVQQVAPESQILPIRVLDPDGRGNTFVVAFAIEWAVRQGATVINLSLGTDADSLILHDVIRWAVAEGVSVVAAAGNGDTTTLHYPAAYTETLTITAVDTDLIKASFANYGPWVDLAAPGVGITSTIVTAQGSGYASWSGTSMAAPFVSGTLALMHQRFPEKSPFELYERLAERGNSIDGFNRSYSGLLGVLLNVEDSVIDKQITYLPYLIVTDGASFVDAD